MAESNNIERGYAAIGRVCAHWADIEWFVQHLALATAPFMAVDYEREDVEFVLLIALAHMDIRNKVATAKVYLDRARISPGLADEATKLLNKIDNELRLERNRYVHDEWIIGEKTAARSTLRPKVVIKQARQSELIMAETKVMSAEDLEGFSNTLRQTVSALNAICGRVDAEFEQRAPVLRSLRQADQPKAS